MESQLSNLTTQQNCIANTSLTPLEWAETNITLSGKPFVPTRFQKILLASNWDNTTFWAYRRKGKTFGLAVYAVMQAITKPNLVIVTTAPIKAMANQLFEYISLILSELIKNPKEIKSFKRYPKNKIEFDNNSSITYVRTFVGYNPDLVLVDEENWIEHKTGIESLRPEVRKVACKAY